VGDEAGLGGVLVGGGVGLVAGRAGVQAQQVVHPIPACGVLGDQVRLGQSAQYRPCRVGSGPGQSRRGQDVKVGARVQAQQPEQPCVLLAQLLVGNLERGPDLQVPGAQLG
jgi:hypothetical protein